MTNPTKAPQEKNLFVPAVDYPDDIFAHEIAAFLSSIDSSVKICNWTPVKNTLMGDWGLLPTLGRSGMTFEVGPSPWGNLNGKTYDQSRKLLLSALDYIDSRLN